MRRQAACTDGPASSSGAGATLVACRPDGLSALGAHYAGVTPQLISARRDGPCDAIDAATAVPNARRLASFLWRRECPPLSAEGVFYGRALVKAVEPGTGWLTIAHNDIMGCMPASEMMFRVRAPDVSRNLRPGDTIDFTLDSDALVILDAKLISRAQ